MRKKTHEEFVKEVNHILGSEYLVKGQYIRSDIKIEMKHLKCGFEYMIAPTKIISSHRGCRKCNHGGFPTKIQDVFEKEVFDLTEGQYKVLGRYINAGTKIKMRHLKCGYQYDVAPSKFLFGRRCPKCNGGIRHNKKEFIERVYALVKDEYVVIGEYINARTKIKMKHNKCGGHFTMEPQCFIRGNRCTSCNIRARKTTEQFIQEVYKLVYSEYEVLGEYIKADIKVKMRHKNCNNITKITPDDFLQGQRCSYCAKNKKKTTEIFKNQLFNLVGSEYEVLEEYISTNTKIKIKHTKCGFEYKVKPAHFLHSGSRCPRCIFSKGERTIERWLGAYNIKYKTQYRFHNCRYKAKLPFDFVIFKNDKISLIIEYDGKQHFQPIKRFGGQEGFKSLQKRDAIKNEYCFKNDIPLLRIPYWKFSNIDQIMRLTFQQYNLLEEEVEYYLTIKVH